MCVVEFDTDGNGRMLSKAELQTPSLLLTEGDTGNLQQVNQLDLNDSFKTLGIHKTISGNDQIASMKKKSDDYAQESFRSTSLTSKAWTGLLPSGSDS
jgi:hypothetical protein